MTYAEALARLLALRGGEHAGFRPGLERVDALLAALGHPERQYALVQVGGTNGKGSIAAMVAVMLRAAGRRVGLYTSPHLVSFRERIRVDGEAISEDRLVDGVEALGTLLARFDVSVFEATTALALDHFAREQVEVAVLEVGLGGRLDATTVGAPAVTVLSRVDLDHEDWLGTTLGAIAAEKAAIIRTGVALSAAQEAEVADVIEDRARAVGVPLLVAGRELSVVLHKHDLGGQLISCRGPGWDLARARLALLGTFQPANALLAVAAAREMGAPEAAVRAGLERVRWPGRLQILAGAPTLVLDAAHNPAGAAALVSSLHDLFGGAGVTFVVGILRDKDAAGILGALAGLAERLILTPVTSPRTADPRTLQSLAPAGIRRVEVAGSVAEALALAMSPATTPIVCVAGSVALIGEVLARRGGGGDNPCPIENGAASMGPLC